MSKAPLATADDDPSRSSNVEEWGYLLLEDTPVYWDGWSSSGSSARKTNASIQPRTWYTLRLEDGPNEEADDDDPPSPNDHEIGSHSRTATPAIPTAAAAATTTTTTANDNDTHSSSSCPCPYCHLVLRSHIPDDVDKDNKDHYSVPYLTAPWPRLGRCRRAHSHSDTNDDHGTANDCVCASPSDTVLLLGWLHEALSVAGPRKEHACRDVRVVESQLLFLDDALQRAVCRLPFTTVTANTTTTTTTTKTTSQRQHPSKPLPSAWQLLFTLWRSDWSYLEQCRAAWASRTVAPNTTTTTLFPSQWTMEALYQRLHPCRRTHIGGSSPFPTTTAHNDDDDNNSPNDHTLLTTELWRDHVAPFLTAADLQRLRSTHRRLAYQLRAVVPGLRDHLTLYQHQVASLVWMRRRERTTEAVLPQGGPYVVDDDDDEAPDGDWHRAVTGGHTVCLRARYPGRRPGGRAIFRVDTATGREVPPSNRQGWPRRRVARGGLLIDEPGLGKTITVLALVLQTAWGPSTPRVVSATTIDKTQQQQPEEEDNEDALLVAAYWRDHVPADFRRQDLLRLLNQVAKCGRFHGMPRPLCAALPALRARIDQDAYAATGLEAWWDHVRHAIEQATESMEDASVIATAWMEAGREILAEYQARLLASAKKSFSNSLAKPNSQLAYMIEESKRRRFTQSLIASRGTLIVIPAVLMDHWESQINLHVDMKYLSPNKIPMVFAFGGDGVSLASAKELIENGMFQPIVFLDRGGTKTLPSAEFLAQFLIVITTTSRFANEWKNGSFQEEVERSADSTPERLYESNLDRNAAEVCPLLKIHWLRMVIDEGHSMGKGALSSSIQFASWISSERRWAMTGTPTKEGSTALSQVRNLMGFLQHEFFTPRGNGDMVWTRYIARPWKEGKTAHKEGGDGVNRMLAAAGANRMAGAFAAFFRLRSLLRLLMKRHTKRDIAELAVPILKESYISMSHVEVNTYNTLVTAIQANLLLTSMKEDARQDSLLHRSQARFAREALQNVRRVCVGFSRVIPTLSGKLWFETESLMQRYGLPNDKQDRVKKFIHDAEVENLTACDCCGFELSILLVLPCCGGLICTECMDGQNSTQYQNDRSEKWMHKPYDDKKRKQRSTRKYFRKDCLLCDSPFDVDNFQRLQPGFVFTWRDSLKAKAAKKNDAGEMPSAALLLGGPVAALVDQMHDHNVERASGDMHAPGEMVVRPPTQRRRTKKPGDGHECEYDPFAIDGRCIHCLEEHESCNLLHSARCVVCHRPAVECPEEETKSSYLVKKCLSLMRHGYTIPRDISRRDEPQRPIKIIVFSQFRKALNVVGDRLLKRFGTACVSEYWGRYRTQELHKFTHDPDCFCMLLGRDGSEGLDLSFVTHIFFLEEIWDKALADQTIARAWRMGAQGPVEVETILARDTVEETMQAYEAGNLQDLPTLKNDATSDSFKQSDQMQRKTHVLLKSLRFITDFHQFRKNPLKRPPKKEHFDVPPAKKRRRVAFADS